MYGAFCIIVGLSIPLESATVSLEQVAIREENTMTIIRFCFPFGQLLPYCTVISYSKLSAACVCGLFHTPFHFVTSSCHFYLDLLDNR